MSRTNKLRIGIILTVTGIIALAHALLTDSTHLGTAPTLYIGIALIAVGVPFIVLAPR
jgi:hypothetical protein